ncbi:hypothetical protein H4582DRAFT_1895549 [Lactarius indigo]|nr:hypothetical protein H4582DRAFT_1895549 [Lactarius indigo]
MLTACALVCKSWLSLTRRLLYHSLTVESSRAYASRKPGTLGPEALLHRSHLLGFIRSLSIRVIDEYTATLPPFPDAPQGSQECVRIPDFLSLLAHIPRLRDLRLSVDWAHKNTHSFEPHVLGWLSSLELPIEVLDLKYGRPFDSPLVYDLVGIWPTIRALRVLTGYSGLPPVVSSLCLRELRLPINSLATLIGWLLPHPPPNEPSNLRFLELYEISEEARAVLSVHGPSVSTLTLTRQPAFGIAHLFTKLEELVIAGPFWSPCVHVRCCYSCNRTSAPCTSGFARNIYRRDTYPRQALFGFAGCVRDSQSGDPGKFSRLVWTNSASLSRRDGLLSSTIHLLRVLRHWGSKTLKDDLRPSRWDIVA